MLRACRAGLLGLALLLLTPALPLFGQTVELAPGSIAQVVGRPGGRANVRSSPAIADGNVIGSLPVGSSVTVQEVGSGDAQAWARVVAGSGIAGWVHRSLLALDRDATATALQEQQQPASMPAPPAVPPEAAQPTAAAPAQPPQAAPAPTSNASDAILANDWTMMVPELMPAITSCAAIPAVQPVTITRAYKVQPNLAGVRMQDPAGRRWECLILRRGGYAIRYEPIGSGQRPMPGDGNPVFIMAPGEPPRDECHKSDEIRDPETDVLLGWRVQILCAP
jgi:hypothetical protein